MPPVLDAEQLCELLSQGAGCPQCLHLQCAGWESASSPPGAPLLECVGTLCDPDDPEPTLQERHHLLAEGRTGYWHPRAPLALRHFPYNRCSVWRCVHCHRGFMQYTEAGGYYLDHRVRSVDPTLIED